MRGDVVDGLPDALDLLRVLVRDLDPELVLELHDQLDEVERIGVEILLEGRLLGDFALGESTELAGRRKAPRSCHHARGDGESGDGRRPAVSFK